MLDHLTVITLKDELGKRWTQGQKIVIEDSLNIPFDQAIRVKNEEGLLLGVGELQLIDNEIILKAKVVLQGF